MSQQNNMLASCRLWLLVLICSLCSFVELRAHHRDSLTAKSVEFVENKGQWESQVRYRATLQGGAIFMEQTAFTFVLLHPKQLQQFYEAKFDPSASITGWLDAAAYRVTFVGADPLTTITAEEPLPSFHNYFIGKEEQKWTTHVHKYRTLSYRNLYPGIDARITQEDAHLKYEFVVAPYAQPSTIKMEYEGIESLSLAKGNLLINTAVMQVIELKPYAYQTDLLGNRRPIDCTYRIQGKSLTFHLGAYDPSLPLVIDPTLIFSSYSGSTADNWGYTATYDKHGNLYSGGNAFQIGYPTTLGAYQVNFGGGSSDIVISKFDAQGSYLHYSTYLGGSGTEVPHSLVVNDNNELYVLGTTSSADYPVTATAYDTTFHGGTSYTLTSTIHFVQGSDIVITKFNAAGDSLLGSTFLGGSGNDGLNTVLTLRKNYADEVRGEIIIDEQSNVYIVSSTQSLDFPTTATAFQPQFGGGAQDGCIVKLNHNLSNLIWSSYFGGTGDDAAYSVMQASDQSLYVCGGTTSPQLPTSANVVQPSFGGGENDGYVAHINPNGNQLIAATYLGFGGYDQAYLVKSDRFDQPHIFGQTNATGNSWIRNAEWNVPGGGQFLIKLSTALDSVIWSTAFGTGRGGLDISPTALLVDLCNNIYMSGWGSPNTNFGQGGTAGLPITPDAFQHTTDNNDYYFICISDDASQLVYATYFGSPHAREHVDGGTSRFDNHGRIYQAVCAGCGGHDDFPTTAGAWSQVNNSSNCNIGVIKFDFNLPAVVADFNVPNTVCAPITLSMNNSSQLISDSTRFFWNFGDGDTSTLANPTHSYTQSGTYVITLVVQDAGSCNFADTATRQLVVLSNTRTQLPDTAICLGDFVQIGIPPSGNSGVSYTWEPTTFLSNSTLSNPIAAPTTTTDYLLFVSDGVCVDTLSQRVRVESLTIDAGSDRTLCLGDTLHLSPMVTGEPLRYYWSDTPSFTHILNSDSRNPICTVTPDRNTTYYLRVVGNHCVAVDSVTISVSSFTLSTPESYEICFYDTIQIRVIPSVEGEYTYLWQPDDDIVAGAERATPWVAPTASTLFRVIATNEYGCTAEATLPVSVRSYQVERVVTDVRCHGGSDGAITLTVAGGTAPYTYSWSHGALSQDVTNLTAGTYSVDITDREGCTVQQHITVNEPDALTITLLETRTVMCNTLCDGYLAVNAMGGTAPYQYNWLHGATGARADSLCAGSYTVAVTDAHQCRVTALFSVIDTSNYTPTCTITPPLCADDCNGALYLDTQMEAGTYRVSWNHDSIINQDTLRDLCAGYYTASIEVDNGCRYQLHLEVPQRAPLRLLNLFVNTPSCHGDSDGSIQWVMTGGTPPYHYTMNGAHSTARIENLTAGRYHLLVSDSHNCSWDTTLVMTFPEPLQVTEQHISPPCAEVCAGGIALTLSGGTPPYQALWNNGEEATHLQGLCAGNYSVTVSDAHNCITTLSLTLTDSSSFPTEVVAWTSHNAIFQGDTITLYTHDWGSTFNYAWEPSANLSSPQLPTTTATPQQNTDYVITVVDSFGCQQRDTVRIIVHEIICDEPYVFVPNAFTPNGDGKNDIMYVRGELVTAMKIEIFDRWGEKVFSSNDQSVGWDGTYRGRHCEVGVYDYYLEVTCRGDLQLFKKGNVTLMR